MEYIYHAITYDENSCLVYLIDENGKSQTIANIVFVKKDDWLCLRKWDAPDKISYASTRQQGVDDVIKDHRLKEETK